MGLLQRAMTPHFARFGISGSQWGVLRTLQRAQEEGSTTLRLTDLSERLLIRPPSVTGVVDRLQRGGLVARESSPDDLRVKQVRLTPKGAELVERVLKAHRSQVTRILGGLTADEQAQFDHLLGRLIGHVEHLLDAGAVLDAD